MKRPPRQQSCEGRVDFHLEERLADLRRLWSGYCSGDEEAADEFSNYGLCFDFVEQNTFSNQSEAYFRYQLSWGGPGDEFRFFVNPDLSCHRAEYWFLDWFDGASRTLPRDCEVIFQIWEHFRETGVAAHAYREGIQ